MQRARERIRQLARVPFPTRVEGPRGSGKRIACRMMHALSPRARGPFVVCNVNMVPVHLELAKLVGNVKGAFTGADRDVPGAFEVAHTGVLVLDEIADASLDVQRILLQLVEERTFSRIGEVRVRQVDVRVIAATNADLDERVRAGKVRPDLFDRLGKCGLRLPALAEHPQDIPVLVAHMLPGKARQAGLIVRGFTRGELDLLMAYAWPGNVRELEHVVEEFVAFGRISEDVIAAVAGSRGWRSQVDDTLRRYGGNKAATARALGISRPTLYAELGRRRPPVSSLPLS